MKRALAILAAGLLSLRAAMGQGQVVFANKVIPAGLDAPVAVLGTNPVEGPGSNFSAQLLLVGVGGALMPLMPASTFRDAPLGATGVAAIANRYWEPKIVDVPGVQPGNNATFVVRAWLTSAGSYESAINMCAAAESAPFTVAVGGGTLPPANLTTLQAFSFQCIPEPSVIMMGFLGGVVLGVVRSTSMDLRRRKV